MSHVVPKFRTKVREWNPWVENIQKLGFEDNIKATGRTGQTKLNIEEVGRKNNNNLKATVSKVRSSGFLEVDRVDFFLQ